MYKYFLSIIFIFLTSSALNAQAISIMSINAQNLFDTIDDPKKDDKAFLPIEMKQSNKPQTESNSITVNRWRMECFFQDWTRETKNHKLQTLPEVIIH